MRVMFTLVLFLVAGTVTAQTAPVDTNTPPEAGVAVACLQMQTDVLRLACYDTALGFVAEVESAPASTSGGWQFVEQEDDFTNQNTSFVFLRSDRAGDTFSDAPSQLVLRCDGSGGSEVFVTSNGYIGARNDRIPVRFRFGEDRPVTENWNESTNGTAAFLPRGYQDFRNGLATRQDFIFEITDFRGSRYSASFDGLSVNAEMLEFVLSGCG
ncbi:MAG: hypothetical protein COW55_01930 [Rhodobacteraceae bacterium CG17_big_fil_post_rev_8_21_14_2_50_65_11]|nr:MAG: hypothetical protein COW55_01930 [Rhodobacteraceae bacterium CG17_big_fil_post_rev_8_21_14_2_50_65_11]